MLPFKMELRKVKKANFSRETENLIAQLRGLPKNSSKSRLRPSKTIEDLIDFNLKSLKLGAPRPEESLMANWKMIVGEKNAPRSCPKSITRNVLFITVANSIIRNEMEFEKINILKRIHSLAHCKNIVSLRFLVG